MDDTSSLPFCLLILTALLMTVAQSEDDFPLVTLAQGTVKGKRINSSVAASFYSFQGIPYAKPPTGELRFKAPLPPDPWNETLNALQEGHACKQVDMEDKQIYGKEDCLFINVFTPQLPGSEPLKPVMVFIHGGGFKVGSGSPNIYRPDFLIGAGVVYVSFNYRLDVFGFLSTEDSAVPGNAGMKDQVQALRWVQQNIAAFGGDPNRVTIFGHSAGATSVNYLVLSPMAKGLFHRAIAHSGSATCPWALAFKPRESAFYLGRALGFFGNSSEDLAGFLRTISSDELLSTAQETSPERNRLRLIKLIYVPSVEPVLEGETSFLPDIPNNILDQGKYQKIPYMTGIVSAEGMYFLKVSGVPNNMTRMKEINENFAKVFKPELRFCKERLCGDDMIARIKSFYLGDKDIGMETVDNYIKLISDVYFNEPVTYGVNKMASLTTKPIYLYEMIHDGGLAFFKLKLGPPNLPGVSHGDDLGYLFNTPLIVKEDSADAKVRSRMVSMWTNFAKTGNPTPEMTEDIPTWLPYSNSDPIYLEIGSELVMKKNIIKRRVDFWRGLYNRTQAP